MATVQGECDPAFRGVRDLFENSFATGENLGAAVAVFVDGKPVVDLWGGVADERIDRAWESDTPCVSFSAVKAVTATAALILIERGLVALDKPVTDWWPEYGTNGKEATTVEHFLTHQAGVPAFDAAITLEQTMDPAALAAHLACQTPEWTPGARHGYHGLTFGWLLAELVRRHTERSVGEFVRAEFGPGLWIGSPPDVIARAARISRPKPPPPWSIDNLPIPAAVFSNLRAAMQDLSSPILRATANPPVAPNNATFLASGWPAGGMLSTARSLAEFYRDLIAGRILRPETVRDSFRERLRGPDAVLVMESAFGLGFMRPSPNFHLPEIARENAFGHPGAAGAIGLGDLEHGLAIAFIPNLSREPLGGDRRAYHLVEATYSAL